MNSGGSEFVLDLSPDLDRSVREPANEVGHRHPGVADDRLPELTSGTPIALVLGMDREDENLMRAEGVRLRLIFYTTLQYLQ